MTLYIAIYAVSGVQRLLDFTKTVYLTHRDAVPIIIKPIGAAAQIGVPDAYKYSYRIRRPLIVLPELTDIKETLGIENIYIIYGIGEPSPLEKLCADNVAIILPGDMEYSKKDLELGKTIKPLEISLEMPPAVIAYAILSRCSS